jgi:hypothetical protein
LCGDFFVFLIPLPLSKFVIARLAIALILSLSKDELVEG